MERNTLTRLWVRALTAILACTPIAVLASATPAAANPGDYQFENLNSNLCLDVVDWGAYNGANVQQWGCWNGSPQQWYFQNGIWAAGKDGWYDTWFQIRSRTTGRCLDVAGVSPNDSANVQVWDCLGDPRRLDQPNQRWAIGYPSNGLMTLRALHSNKCLEVYGLSRDYGGNVVQFDCWLGPNQKWYYHQLW